MFTTIVSFIKGFVSRIASAIFSKESGVSPIGTDVQSAVDKKLAELISKTPVPEPMGPRITGKNRKAVSSFFCSTDGRFNVIYFWTTVFLALVWFIVAAKVAVVVFVMVEMSRSGKLDVSVFNGLISDALILGLLGFVTTFVFVYNRYKIKARSISDTTPERK